MDILSIYAHITMFVEQYTVIKAGGLLKIQHLIQAVEEKWFDSNTE